jgi:ribosomal protein L16 Arg81 hydroxylase
MSHDDTDILYPLTREQFFSEHWEQAPLHIERSNRAHFSSLLSIADIEALLSTGGQSYPDVQIVNSNADIPIADYTDDNRQIVTPGLWRHYHAGGTLIISGAARRFPNISTLCRRTSVAFHMRSHANVYLSPGSQQGFNAHYDTHDVFVLQVSGRKEFRFYHSDIELPFVDSQFSPEHLSDDPAQRVIEQTVQLNAGDTLYIPRGVVHDAVALGAEPSLHITLGVYPVVVRDLLQEMIQVAAEDDVNFRRSIAMAAVATDGNSGALQQMLSAVVTAKNYEAARARLFDEIALDIVPGAAGQLSHASAESSFAIDPDAILSVERDQTVVKVRAAGQVLEFSEPYASAVEALIEHRIPGTEALKDLDSEQRGVLYEQLRCAGCLVVGN